MRHALDPADDRRVALTAAASAGIHCLALPTPYAVGTVNAYLLEGDPLTLVDCGPSWPPSLEALDGALAAHGYAIADLDLLVLTHQHMDHVGLAENVARRSGAEVAALDGLGDYLERWDIRAAADHNFAASTMLRHGVAGEVVDAIHATTRIWRHWAAPTAVDRRLEDGGVLESTDRRLHVLHRPGHSPSDTVFWDETRRIAIVADHLLRTISSNALIALPLEPGGTPFHALLEYRRSLRRMHDLDAELLLTGHGDPILNHRDLIDQRLGEQETRAQRLLDRLRGSPPCSVRDLALDVFGRTALEQPLLTTSEVLGHLELLQHESLVATRERSDGGVVWEAA